MTSRKDRKNFEDLTPEISGSQFIQAGLLWACAYLSPFVSEKTWIPSADHPYATKAVGEFLLFSELLHRDWPADAPEYDAIRALRSELADQLNEIADDIDICGVTWQLMTCISDNVRLAKKSRDTRPRLGDGSMPIEKAYFLEMSDYELPAEYWHAAANIYINDAMTSGCSWLSVYTLTHIVFFGTDFGRRSFQHSVNRLLAAIIVPLVSKARNYCNWDAAAELGLALLCCGQEHADVVTTVCRQLKRRQSIRGWVLSDGTRLKFYEDRTDEMLTDRELYSLFHTTLVACYFVARASASR